MSLISYVAAQVDVAAAGEPNYLVIGIIVGVMVLLAIIFLIPPKEPKALEDKDKVRILPDAEKTEHKAIEDKTEADKEKMSLAEIKESKRAVVSEEKTKEELRELRRERRAATQTEKAIQEREETQNVSDDQSADESEIKSEVSESAVSVTEKDSKSDNASQTNSDSLKSAASSVAEAAGGAALASADDFMGKEEKVDPEDVFAKLFGNADTDAEDSFSLDDFGGSSRVDSNTAFPMLGSALIPLSEQTKNGQKTEKEELETLDELTRRFAEKAEKKTLS